MKHKLKDNYRLFWKYIYKLREAPSDFQKDYFDNISLYLSNHLNVFKEDNLAKDFYQRVEKAIIKGETPILISHSQGNFYANQVSFILDNLYYRKYSNIQIASPVSNIQGENSFSYLRDDDKIIASIVGSLVGAQVPQRDSYTIKNFLNHSFVNSYLGDSKARNKIIEYIAHGYLDTEDLYDSKDHVLTSFINESKNKDDCSILILTKRENQNQENKNIDSCLGFNDTSGKPDYNPCHCLPPGKYRLDISLTKETSLSDCRYQLNLKSKKSHLSFEISGEKSGNISKEFELKFNGSGLIFQ